VVGFTEALSFELAPLGIRARYIAPGGVTTEFAVQDAEQAYSLRLSFPTKSARRGQSRKRSEKQKPNCEARRAFRVVRRAVHRYH
jgi:short-subunit dehydrogenase